MSYLSCESSTTTDEQMAQLRLLPSVNVFVRQCSSATKIAMVGRAPQVVTYGPAQLAILDLFRFIFSHSILFNLSVEHSSSYEPNILF
jgi:hypothetical protein